MKFASIIHRVVFATILLSAPAAAARADVIMDWNAKADAIAAEKQTSPASPSEQK